MSKSEIEQSDLKRGYTYFEVTNVLNGTGTDKHVVLRGGKHPKCRLLLSDSSTKIAKDAAVVLDYSYLSALTFTAKSPILAVIHRDGGIAAVNEVAAAVGDTCPFKESGADEDVFEANEDIIVYATTAGDAGINLLVLKFEVVN